MRLLLLLLLTSNTLCVLSQGSGNALDFDGSNDHVLISDNAVLDIQEAITIEFWFLLEGDGSTNDFPRVVSKGQTSNNNGAYGIFIRDISNPTDIGFRFIDASGTSRTTRSNSVQNYDDGEWHHVAATYSNTDDISNLYVDGLLEASVSITGNTLITSTTDDLSIGAGLTNRFFNGQIDDVRIWNVARTRQQVREFMCVKLLGTENGLVGYWNFDGVSTGAGNVPDLTANGLNGTMTNMVSGDVVISAAPIGDESIQAYINDWGGNCLEFDGSNDYVDIGDVLVDGTGDITVEAWIYPTAIPTKGSPTGHNSSEGAIIHKNGGSDDNLGLTVASGGLAFYVDNGSNNTLVGTAPTINTWTHVAATYDGTNLIIYVNGVLDATQASTGSGNFVNNTNSLRIGGGHVGGGSPHEFTGRINEVRVWNYARSATEITNDMCRSLEGDETGLTGYWRFDELVNETVAEDGTGSNDGTLTNMNAATAWVTADHVCSYTDFDIYMQSIENDSFRVSSVTGNPDGIHLYHVTDVPNSITGITGLGENSSYYGVWQVRGTSPSYNGSYYFNENDAWQNTAVQIETDLLMFTRDDNAVSSWTDAGATLNTTANTLTSSESNSEFILGLAAGALPIDLIDFQAKLNIDQVDLTWATASEINNEFFILEKSFDAKNWVEIIKRAGAGNSNARIDYKDVDPTPYLGTSYYRLRQIDFDGQTDSSIIRAINFNEQDVFSIYPNPTNNKVLIVSEHEFKNSVKVKNSIGQDITQSILIVKISSNQVQLNLETIPSGTYVLQVGEVNHLIVKN